MEECEGIPHGRVFTPTLGNEGGKCGGNGGWNNRTHVMLSHCNYNLEGRHSVVGIWCALERAKRNQEEITFSCDKLPHDHTK